jgi:hypothetical protein
LSRRSILGDGIAHADVDRAGPTCHFDEAVALAHQFCAAEPQVMLVAIEASERKWAQDAARPGEEYMVSLLNEYRATWALSANGPDSLTRPGGCGLPG